MNVLIKREAFKYRKQYYPTGSLSRGYRQKYNVGSARSNGKANLGIDVITRVITTAISDGRRRA